MTNLYWVGNSGSWGDSAHWSFLSGGVGGAGVPGTGDDVFFDANSFSAIATITIHGFSGFNCHNLDASAITHACIFDFKNSFSSSNLNVYGNITVPSLLTATSNDIQIQGFIIKGTCAMNSSSSSLNCKIDIDTGATLNLSSTLSTGIIINDGTFNTNNHTLNCTIIEGGGGASFGSSTINLTATLAYPIIISGNFNAGTSTINIFGKGSSSNIVTGFWNVNVINTTGGLFTFFNDTLFENLTINPGCHIAHYAGYTYTVNGVLLANGTSGNKIVFQSTAPGNTYTNFANAVSLSYIDVADSIAAGAIPFVDSGGYDNGNNTNWSFSGGVPPFALPDILNIGDLTFDFGQLQGSIPNIDWDQLGIVFSNTDTIPNIDDTLVLLNPPDPVVIRFGIIGPYYVNLTGLIDGQTYYVRTFGQIGGVYYYGPVISFVTPARAAITLPGANSPLSNYQFLLYDPAGNLVADLSGYIDAREFTLTRNRPEEITFTINFYTLNKLASDLHLNAYDMLKPGIQEIRVVRKGTVICAGQIVYWDASLGGEQQITVKALGWMNLFSYRVFSGEYDGDDANFIIRDLITQTQALTNGNFGVTLGASATGTNVYTQKIFENKVISDILIEMSEEENGFDFQFSWDKIFTVYHPSQGSDRPEILFTSPGNMKEVTISNDATQIVNSLLARGKGNADANINTIITDAPSQVTYKLRTAVKDYPDMDADQLIQEASAEVAYYRNPVVLHTITYDAGNKACPEIGNYNVGDRVRIFVTGLPILQDFNQYFKIDKIHVTLGKDGSETVELSVNNIITL